jgi:hypothetical protein
MTNETKNSSIPALTLGDKLQFSSVDSKLRYAPSWTPVPAESQAGDHHAANLQALVSAAEKIIASSENMKPAGEQ